MTAYERETSGKKLSSKEEVSRVMKELEAGESRIPEKDKAFYLSIKRQFKERGITEKQFYWMKKFHKDFIQAGDSEKLPEADAGKAAKLYNFQNIWNIIQNALNSGIKFPSILVSCDIENCGHREFKIYWSERFRNVGISAGKRTFCTVSESGSVKLLISPGVQEKEKLDTFLSCIQFFNDDPAEAAKLYGKMTSRCCFCGHELSTGESVAVGYGPICAEHFGLPWGEEKASVKVSKPVKELLDLDLDDSIPF